MPDDQFNKKAQKSYEELSADQQGIDIYIAKKVLDLANSFADERIEEAINIIKKSIHCECYSDKNHWESCPITVISEIKKLKSGG